MLEFDAGIKYFPREKKRNESPIKNKDEDGDTPFEDVCDCLRIRTSHEGHERNSAPIIIWTY